MFQCPVCGEDKPLADFYAKGRAGRQWCCKECMATSPVRVKRCRGCGEAKPPTEFYGNRGGQLQGNCKKCSLEKYAKYRADRMKSDPEWAEDRLAYRRNWYRDKRNRLRSRLYAYNITIDQWEEIVDLQGGVCPICGSADDLVVDHDHNCCDTEGSCGRCVRGAICQPCNVGLGRFKDDPDRLAAAREYVLKWRAHVG